MAVVYDLIIVGREGAEEEEEGWVVEEGGGSDSGARGWQRRRIWSSATSGAPSCSRALLRSPIPHYRTSAVGTRRGLEEATERHSPRGENRWNDPDCACWKSVNIDNPFDYT